MDTFNTPDLGWLTCEIVVLGDPEGDLAASYCISCRDLETGRFVGSTVLPARPDGRPPRVSLGDIVGLIGGYRLASIYVEIKSERLIAPALADFVGSTRQLLPAEQIRPSF
jgi:hypothetical protein